MSHPIVTGWSGEKSLSLALIALWTVAVAGVRYQQGGFMRPPLSPELPPYCAEIQTDGHEQTTCRREQTVTLSAASLLLLALRPVDRIRGPVFLRCFLQRDGQLQRWNVEPVRTPAGAFLITAPLTELPELWSGSIDLVCAAASDETLLQIDPQVLLARTRRTGVSIVRTELQVQHLKGGRSAQLG